MNEQEFIRLDEEAKKEIDEFRKQFNFINRGNHLKHFYQKDESLVQFMKSYIDRHYKRRYPERF
jgi:hypothetical protein